MGGGGTFNTGGRDVCIPMAEISTICKAIILQLKINKIFKKTEKNPYVNVGMR